MLMLKASTQYAIVEFSKSNVTGSRKPANFAIEYSVLGVHQRELGNLNKSTHPVVSWVAVSDGR